MDEEESSTIRGDRAFLRMGPTRIVAVVVRATVSRTDTVAPVSLETYALSRSGDKAIRTGASPTGILVVIWSVEVSITATASDNLVTTNKEDAKADEAKA